MILEFQTRSLLQTQIPRLTCSQSSQGSLKMRAPQYKNPPRFRLRLTHPFSLNSVSSGRVLFVIVRHHVCKSLCRVRLRGINHIREVLVLISIY